MLLSIDFLSFFGIPDLKLSAVLFTVLLSELLTKHSIPQTFTVYHDIVVLPTKTHDWSPDQAIDWIHDRAMDCIGTNYILTNCLKIQQNFLAYYKMYWINSEVYNLDFTVFLQHSDGFSGVLLTIFLTVLMTEFLQQNTDSVTISQ